jgi:hypothetical protein
MHRISFLKIILCCLLIIVSGCILASSEPLPESVHPYSNDFEQTWPPIQSDGATQIRLHFDSLKLARVDGPSSRNDKLILSDKYGEKLKTYESVFGVDEHDFWTDWYETDTLNVTLDTDSSGTDYGFKIDKKETRMGVSSSPKSLPESDHPYASHYNYTWPAIVSNKPGTSQIQIHFEYLDLSDEDKLVIYNKYGNIVETYPSWFTSGKKNNFWTKLYQGDELKVELLTSDEGTSNGFKIDDKKTLDEPNNPSLNSNNSETTKTKKIPESSSGKQSTPGTASSQTNKETTINNYNSIILIPVKDGKIFDIHFVEITNQILQTQNISILIVLFLLIIFCIYIKIRDE